MAVLDWFRSQPWWEAFIARLRGADARSVTAGPGFTWGGACDDYAALYRTQPHVRTVVSFLAENMGQLGIGVFRRLSDTDRVRVVDHPLAQLLDSPNPGTTRYEWISGQVSDLCVFGHTASLKVRRPDRLELYRIPAAQIRPVGDLIAREFVWTLPSGHALTLDAADVFFMREYNPDDPVAGLSPLETLRALLAEEEASVQYRKWFWSNGAKLGGWISREKDAPRWTDDQRTTFRSEWAQFSGPQNAGKSPVLEDGMQFHPVTASARDSDLIPARKLSREEVTAAFHVPPASVGITEAQGYGSIREQHRATYQDALGTKIAKFELEIQRQLRSEFADDDVYVQFNIAEKMQGSFEEEQAALSTAVGAPYMARNEARGRMNLPRVPDPAYDKPVTRLDLVEGQNAAAATPTEDTRAA